MTRDDDSWPPEQLQALLSLERDTPAPGGETRGRVAARLSRTLGVAMMAAPLASSSLPTAATPAHGVAAAGKSLATKLLLAALLGSVGAGGLVATLRRLHRHGSTSPAARSASPSPAPSAAPVMPGMPVRIVPSSTGSASLASRSAGPALAASPATSSPRAAWPLAASPAPSSPALRSLDTRTALAASKPRAPHRAAHDGDLGAERALLGDARAAMQADDAAQAIAILDAHLRRFPAGQLAEERDALRVGALWRAGDHAEARHRAVEFAHRHPDSLFLPSVQRAVTESPGAAQ